MPNKYTLVSHHLCPYVQRVAIAFAEKAVPFTRTYVDLANKPPWFLELSPLAKVPVLQVQVDDKEFALFESSVILEYLEETLPTLLLQGDPQLRAEQREMIVLSSEILQNIGKFYSAPTRAKFHAESFALTSKFEQIESRLNSGPFFDGHNFCLVDAVFAPIFRYFDVFDQIGNFKILSNMPKLNVWRMELAQRDSVRGAVSSDYNELFLNFLIRRESYLSQYIVDVKLAR